MQRFGVIYVVTALLFGGQVSLSEGHTNPAPTGQDEEKKETKKSSQSSTTNEITEAEKIGSLVIGLDQDKKSLLEIENKLRDPQGSYATAEKRFVEAEKRRDDLASEIEKVKKAKDKQIVKKLQAEAEKHEKEWQEARAAFNLQIRELKSLQKQASTLRSKIKQDQLALDRLKGIVPPPEPTSKTPNSQNQKSDKDEKSSPPSQMIPGLPLVPGNKTNPPKDEKQQPLVPAKEDDKEAKKLRQKIEKAESALNEARENETSVAERLKAHRAVIAAQEELVQSSREQLDLADTKIQELNAEIKKKEQIASDEAKRELRKLNQELSAATSNFSKQRTELKVDVEKLQKLKARETELLNEQVTANRERERREKQVQKAKQELTALENPFTLRNILRWGYRHGPRLVGILIGIGLLLLVVRLMTHRIINTLLQRDRKQKSEVQRVERVKTMVGVIRTTLTWSIIGIGLLMMLGEIGVPITPLMGGAAVFGLAISFASQNLIRDFFTGFNILAEDQYGIGDFIKIGDITGSVERMNLRVTTLRGLDGTLHFIPHGSVTTVSNMTHTWSRALLNIGVAYKENVDQVIHVIKEVGKELRETSDFRPLILDDLNMLGVDDFGDSAIMIKFYVKTMPNKQWFVKRELMRRIKLKFDELGIEIPFPQRTVYHRYEGNGSHPGVEMPDHHEEVS
ncbi:MAG: mechanosensitive ion channel domain-containing protein [Gemmataceae bacterium]